MRLPSTLPDLPVRRVLDQLQNDLAVVNRMVLEAPPGAGKTTLVPLAIAASSWLEGRCVVLEPRRIAARAAASRMAELLGEDVGQTVGYITGEGSRVGPRTVIQVVTEGVLVRRIQHDPLLEGIGAVVLDEFHERAIDADLALAFALQTQAGLRENLRIIVMSATLEGGRVADLLNSPSVGPGGSPRPCAVVRSSGRTFDVSTRYLPARADARIGQVVAAGVRDALGMADGDVLAFLPGRREIEEARTALGGLGIGVHPLYGALGADAQHQALRPDGSGRRVVLATDIAESSLTVPGVRIVVDGGWARRPAFDPTTGMSQLRTVRVSRASADQRRGRAGREGPGLCLRLWGEQDALADHAQPSMMEEDLTPTALEVAAWSDAWGGRATDLGVSTLALLDQPPTPTWEAACEVLRQLGAIQHDGTLTPHGRAMVALPVHPRLAHMVLSAPPGTAGLAADVAALLGGRDILIGAGRDLESRVRALHGNSNVGQLRHSALRRVKTDARRIRRRVAGTAPAPDAQASAQPVLNTDDQVGVLVALAYPDRVARARGTRGSFVMAGGRGAVLPDSDPLAGEEMIAVAALDRGDRVARIYLAAALDRASVDRMAHSVRIVEWRGGDVVAVSERRYGAVVLSTSPLSDPPVEAVHAALLEGIAAEELRPLPWSADTTGLRQRLAHLHLSDVQDTEEAGGRSDTLSWPGMDDATLIAGLPDWVGPFLGSARRRRDLTDFPLRDALMSRVPFPRHRDVDRLAPTHLGVPTGRSVAVDYAGERPVLAVKLQELFGLEVTPAIAGQPVLIHMLSPAGRPLQITDDLAGFWTGSYHQVRADMRGRYPKHPWPEDPATATPTHRTKRRQKGQT